MPITFPEFSLRTENIDKMVQKIDSIYAHVLPLRNENINMIQNCFYPCPCGRWGRSYCVLKYQQQEIQ
ncbi:hypothetical protein F8M41_025452 [Gigaspora margarita]|uniref:Uncharacterized protein n=1 Tax=Gigaspora margarita TaxID=4874 RepID=A0A8H4ET48_GIGMA|nr:hypothetical protein F8M41_025452 [Gigaspora margarita]